jgi:hypothetical protein
MRPPTSAMRVCSPDARHHLSHYVPSSEPPVVNLLVSRHTRQTTRSTVAPVLQVTRPTSTLQQLAWHDAVNARILHPHIQYLRRGLLNCSLGSCHSCIRARDIRLGSRSRHKGRKGVRAVVCTLPPASFTHCTSCGTRDGSGQSIWINWL